MDYVNINKTDTNKLKATKILHNINIGLRNTDKSVKVGAEAGVFAGSVIVAGKYGILAGLGAAIAGTVVAGVGIGLYTCKKDFKDNTVYRHNKPVQDVTPN